MNLGNGVMRKIPIIICFFILGLLGGILPSFAQETLLHEEWMGAYYQDKKFGFAHVQEWEVKKGNKVGYRLEGESFMKIKIPDQTLETFFKETTWLDDKLMLEKVYFRQQVNTVKKGFFGGEQNTKVSTMELWGERTARGLSVKVKSGDQEQTQTLTASPGVLTSTSASFVLFRRGLEAGKKYTLEILIEPLLLVERAEINVKGIETVKFQGKDIEAYVLEVKYADNKVISWVSTKTGENIKKISSEGAAAQFLQGFTSKRESKNEALTFDPARVLELEELFAWSLIPVKKPIKEPQKLKNITVRLSKLPQKDYFIQDERQSWSQVGGGEGNWGGQLRIKVDDFAEGQSLPLSEVKKGKEEYIKSDAFAQSNHPEIIALAKQIVGSETNTYRASKKINQWVFKNIKKKYQDSFSALDILKTLEGACQGHSQLFGALARSQGIPTRMAYGLVYQPSEKGFLYHQWPEVWVGRWVALDPTWGQDLADATHIKLAQGGQEAALRVVSLVGKVELEVVARGE